MEIMRSGLKWVLFSGERIQGMACLVGMGKREIKEWLLVFLFSCFVRTNGWMVVPFSYTVRQIWS